MTDAIGTRAVFSVVLPATNAVTEPDMAGVRVPGVTNQTFRFPFPARPETVDGLIDLMRPTIALALACEPDRVVVGYSTEFLPDGGAVAARLRAFVEETVGAVPVTMASDAVPEALRALGARRIGIVTPYAPETNENVRAFFAGLGFSVAAVVGRTSATGRLVDAARVDEAFVRAAFAEADAPDVDALAQVGTNLVCAGFAADLETRHTKPVVAVNTATLWTALRAHGIADRLDGHGSLFNLT